MEKVPLDAKEIAERLFESQDFEYCEQVLYAHLKENKLDFSSFALLAKVFEKQYRPELALQNFNSAILIAQAHGEDISDYELAVKRLKGEVETQEQRKKTITKQRKIVAEKEGAPDVQSEKHEATIKISRKIFPYLGFAEKQSSNMLSNDYGYRLVEGFKGETLPYIKAQPNEFIVGVFGGSIASAFYQDGVRELTDLISAHPDLTGREITVLNFAMSGSKQPEPLIALAYFTSIGQEFDLIFNIDGLNDLAGCSSNMHAGHHIGMPPADISNVFTTLTDIPALNAEALEYFLRIAKLDKKLSRIENGNRSLLDMFKSAEGLKKQRAQLMADKPVSDPEANLIHLHRTKVVKMELLSDQEFDRALDEIALFWERCIFNMIGLCNALKITYVHSFHPSHFLREAPLGPVDQALIDSASVDYYRRLVTVGFPKLIQRAENFRDHWSQAHYCSLKETLEPIEDAMLADAVAHFKPNVHHAMARKLGDFTHTVRFTI